MDYGRNTLVEHGFPTNNGVAIEPGKFVLTGPGPFETRVVPDGSGPYVGVVLDRPLNGSNIMISTPMAVRRSPLDPEVRLGTWMVLETRRNAIGHDLADRAYDLASVVEELLRRFHADLRHPETGFVAESRDDLQFAEETDATGRKQLIGFIPLPIQALAIEGPTGAVYSSHFRCPEHLLPNALRSTAFDRDGFKGALSLAGMITCTWAVLQDRLRELIVQRRELADIRSIHRVVGRSSHPIAWTTLERCDLAAIRGELESWRPVVSVRFKKDLIGHEKKVWKVLQATLMSTAQISQVLGLSEAEIRNCVSRIRKKKGQDSIVSLRGGGYYRSDSPPPSMSAPVRRRGVRVRSRES